MAAGRLVIARGVRTNDELFARARQSMPGGVSSPVRAFGAVGGTPPSIERAEGCWLVDVEGRRYLDYIGSWGAMIAGHAHPRIVEAVTEAARSGTSFGTCGPHEVELVELVRQRVPSIERLRLVNSGTEAVMSAVRLARAATGRTLVVKFAGGYHGHADHLLVRAGSGPATLGTPDSAGVTPDAAGHTLVTRYNDAAEIASVFERHGDDIAVVVVEPVAGNMGVVPPAPGFLETLRALTTRYGAVLLFDEVMTGFRVAAGGAQQRYGVRPDLTTFGKIIGGGLPAGAYGGRAELMDLVAPSGPVYQAGTLSGNPLVCAAGRATLELLDDGAYAALERSSARLERGLRDALGAGGAVQRVGSMLTVFLGVERVEAFADAQAADHGAFAALFHALLEAGIHLPPSGYEAWFLSLAHDDDAVDRTIEAFAAGISRCGRATGRYSGALPADEPLDSPSR